MPMLQADPLPITEGADGSLRVGQTRVLLELVVHAFEDGATPEAIVRRFPTLQLPDVYSVIAHFLRHRDETEEYLRRREGRAGEVARRIEDAQPDLGELRRRVRSSRVSSRPDHAAPGG